MVRQRHQVSLCAVMLLILPAAEMGHCQEGLTRGTFIVGDLLVSWSAGVGTSISYRGIPVFTKNAGEIVVHNKWTDIYHHRGYGEETATLTRGPAESTLRITNRTEHFAYEKQITGRADGTIHIEYAYEVLKPDAAELQVLWGLGKQWIDHSTYTAVVDGTERAGELACPETGRLHPWSKATRQVFATQYGTFSIDSDVGLALYAEPDAGRLWWPEALKRGERYTHTVDVRIVPGPAAERGVAVSALDWPDVVRDGNAQFRLSLSRAKGGPERIRAHVEPAFGGHVGIGAPVEAALGEAATEITCSTRVERRGTHDLAVVIADAVGGAELLRLSPLYLEAAPILRALPRLSLYTGQEQAEIVADIADDVPLEGLTVAVRAATGASAQAVAASRRVSVPLGITALPDGATTVECRLMRGDEQVGSVETTLRKAPPRPNAVVIDQISRGLIVDGLPLVPFGYYTYYPLKEGVMDEEVVRGFNLFSPYHGGPHDTEALEPIRAYLDRCAQIGMRVNYHLRWPIRTGLDEQHREQLRGEIEAFRDHPALLSWYIADEPAVDKVSVLEEVYGILKNLDPYHPVTIVFCRGAEDALNFSAATDIVMADPYPIPRGSVTSVSKTADAFNEAFDLRKPLWIVPQAFGGGEWWEREPTAGEQRVMTYLALIHGARAIQYFTRSPRTSFPKSPIMWAECGAMALETAELTPALTSVEVPPAVTSSIPSVHATALLDRGVITILAVNTENRPQVPRFKLEGVDFTGRATVLFENRQVEVNDGVIEEPIGAYGSRAYAVEIGPMPTEDISISERNMVYNPSWEDNPSVGTPSGNYAGVAPGASMFVDARVARHGRHSVRLTTPTDDVTVRMGEYPVTLKGGQQYRVSIWAKAKTDGVVLKLSMGELIKEQVALTTEWRELSYTISPEKDIPRASLGIGLASAGVAWVDLCQIVATDG